MEHEERLRAALADRYRIEREIGRGGTATVYLAEDRKHRRLVALKVLRPELAAVLGAERFLKEVEVTANLQHPHILPLHDSGEADGFLYYVMPYVEGESLRAKLDREKQLPVAESVDIAKGVANALDYAHRQGVIHRDIKPENILLHDGQPVVADFGVALAVSAAGGARLTETGLSVGTPHYMSPEQASADRELDGRTDLYSLGATLYEMLTGQPPFTGASAQAIVAKILTEEPPSVTRERPSVPPHVDVAVQICLAKLPADRFSSAAELGIALSDPRVTDSRARRWAQRPDQPKLVSLLSLTLLALVLVLSGVSLWGWMREIPREVSRFVVTLPEDSALTLDYGPSVALSPDGQRMVYVGPGREGGKALWVKELDELDPTFLPESEGAFHPFFSPDGQKVGFVDEADTATVLKVVSLVGEPPMILADSGVIPHGASWGKDGHIYVSEGIQRVIVKVPEDGGGIASTVTHLDEGETDHMWPHVLPNGRGLLMTVMHSGSYEYDDADVAVVDLATGEHRTLLRGSMPLYASSGHLIFVGADGTLFSAPFDQDRLRCTGEPVAIAEGIALGGLGTVGAADVAISESGTLLYVSAPRAEEEDELVWVSRDGTEEPIDPDLRFNFDAVALSPDGNRIAMGVYGGVGISGVWVYDVDSRRRIPLAIGDGSNRDPFWHPDGKLVTFYSDRDGVPRIYSKVWDNSGSSEALAELERSVLAGDWDPSGEWFLLQEGSGRSGPTGMDIVMVWPGVDSVPRPFQVTEFNEGAPSVSPNGDWVAYESNEVGPREVFVRPFGSEDPKWQVSSGGGREPHWAPDGTELFFVSGDCLVAVDVETEPTFSHSAQQELFSFTPYLNLYWFSTYDVAPDGRFLMIRQDQQEVGRLIRITNIFEVLRKDSGS